VRRHLNHAVPIRPYHASDALGLAIIGLFRTGSGGGAGVRRVGASDVRAIPARRRGRSTGRDPQTGR
jgi:hypothetical protein